MGSHYTFLYYLNYKLGFKGHHELYVPRGKPGYEANTTKVQRLAFCIAEVASICVSLPVTAGEMNISRVTLHVDLTHCVSMTFTEY